MSAQHVIVAGDTLQSIAADYYGDANQWERVFKANAQRLKNTDTLNLGEKITIPGKTIK